MLRPNPHSGRRGPRLLAAALSAASAVAAPAGQDAAPSSHLVFDDRFEGDILIHEVRVPHDGLATFTYYEVLGWRGRAAGYAGIQAHPKGRNFLFSIWDNPSHTAPIKAVHRGPGTVTEAFGGEGTGLKSWNFELGWDTDVWYTLLSRCWPVGGHTHYGFWARSAKTGEWTHLVTMDVAAEDAFFEGGTDAFIEDWLETGGNPRTTHLRGGWKRKRDGEWHPFGSARYSVNAWDLEPGKRSFNFRTNWNGGVARDDTGDFYFMTAGGRETAPAVANPSTHSIGRAAGSPGLPPIAIRSAAMGRGEGGAIVVTWETDPRTLPQFGFSLTVDDDSPGEGGTAMHMERIGPDARQAEWILPDTVDRDRLRLRLRCRDVLDNESAPVSLSPGARWNRPAPPSPSENAESTTEPPASTRRP